MIDLKELLFLLVFIAVIGMPIIFGIWKRIEKSKRYE